MELLIVTGMSGAGKSQAANVLEDIGYYCVDNIPVELIVTFADMLRANGEIEKAAVVTDVRVGKHFDEIIGVLDRLKGLEIDYKILFLDCSDDVLIRRYKETRRKHPLVTDKRSLTEAVQEERLLLSPVRERADYIFVTTDIAVRHMKQQLASLFLEKTDGMSIRCMSFGFKYGSAAEADVVIDVRCLPNPFYIEELRPLTGLDAPIRDYVMENDTTKEYKSKLMNFLDYSVPLYSKEGKSQLVIAVGCTGGKHRSVVFAEFISKHFSALGYNVSVTHRDISK